MTLGASKANSHIFNLSSVGSSGKIVNRLEERGIVDIVDRWWLEIAKIYQNANISFFKRTLASKIKKRGEVQRKKWMIGTCFR
jgi:hypothetical protein